MATDPPHLHPASWSFPIPPEAEVTTTRQVLEGLPILLVNHGQNGRWLLHCGTTEDLADKRTACFGCVVEAHPEMVELADLAPGQAANRETPIAAWRRVDPRGPRKLLEDAIAATGWQVIVQPPERPLWAYTVGLGKSFGQPEVFVMGLPGEIMHRMLQNLASEVAAGAQLSVGQRNDTILERLICELRPVDARWIDLLLEPLNLLYEDAPFTVLQCVWPDRAGTLPHEPGFDETFRPRQPLLEHLDPDRAGMTPLLRAMGKA